MVMDIKIIEYEPRYAMDTVEMWRQSMEEAIGQENLHTFEEHVHFLNYILRRDNKVDIAIDEIKNKVIGILAFNEKEINQLYIHKDYQGNGLGKRFLDIAKSNSSGKLTLYTFEVNRKAQLFYESNGFEIIGRGNDNEEKLKDIKYQWIYGE
jgi:ribosomal protein S18 acetylase RimI-like enzyme